MFIINPGTEQQKGATVKNAIESAKQFAKDLDLDGLKIKRLKVNDDKHGWYGFKFIYQNRGLEIEIPGVEPNVFLKGIPFESPRCYVDGSSWLYGYGLGRVEEILTNKEE